MSGESCAPRGSLLLLPLATLEAPVLAADSRGRLRAGGPQYRGAAVLSLHPCTPPRYATRPCRTQGPKTTCLLWAPASKGRPPGRVECRPLLASTATLLATPSPVQCVRLSARCWQCAPASADRATPSSSMRRPPHWLARFTTRPRHHNAPRRRRPGCSSPRSSSRLHAGGHHPSPGQTEQGQGAASTQHRTAGLPCSARRRWAGASRACHRDAVSGSAPDEATASTHVPCSHTRQRRYQRATNN